MIPRHNSRVKFSKSHVIVKKQGNSGIMIESSGSAALVIVCFYLEEIIETFQMFSSSTDTSADDDKGFVVYILIEQK